MLSNELTNWLISFFSFSLVTFVNVMKRQRSAPQTALSPLVLSLLYFYPHTFNYQVLLPFFIYFLQAPTSLQSSEYLIGIKQEINSLLLEAFLVG